MARPKGSLNKKIRVKRRISENVAATLAQLDRSGRSMAQIQIDAARYLETVAIAERNKPEPRLDDATKYAAMAAKVAHDVSPYLYPALQSIKHGGDADAPPIRMENLSEFQLEQLVQRLSKG